MKYLKIYRALIYVYIYSEKERLRARKIMVKVMVGKLCGYEGQISKVYCIRLEYSSRIIRVRDVRFIEDHPFNTYNKSVPPIYKAIFKNFYTN